MHFFLQKILNLSVIQKKYAPYNCSIIWLKIFRCINVLGSQLKELEDMLSDVYTTSQFVDTALDSGTDTQLILVKKQAGYIKNARQSNKSHVAINILLLTLKTYSHTLWELRGFVS